MNNDRLNGPGIDSIGVHHDSDGAAKSGRLTRAEEKGVILWYDDKLEETKGVLVATDRPQPSARSLARGSILARMAYGPSR